MACNIFLVLSSSVFSVSRASQKSGEGRQTSALRLGPILLQTPFEIIEDRGKVCTVADLEGAQQAPPPPKMWSTAYFSIPFCIRMLKNKAQIARESIKNPESFQGP